MAYLATPKEPYHSPDFEFEPDWPDESDLERKDSRCYLHFWGLPIPRDRFPKKVILRSKHNIKSDVIFCGCNKWVVSERVRDILSSVAPDQVDYIPIEIVKKNGTAINEHRYCYTNFLNSIETIRWSEVEFRVDVERKTGIRFVELPRDYFLGKKKLGIKLDRTGYEDVHIWHERNADRMSNWVFMSDHLVDAMRKANIPDMMYEYIEG